MQEWKCAVCGYAHREEQAPETCPVCGAGRAVFEVQETTASVKTETAEGKGAPAQSASSWRCAVCAYVHGGISAPETCPVCGANRSAFEPLTGKEEAPEPQARIRKEEKTENAQKKSPHPDPRTHPRQWVDEQILLHHAHPISVHIPNGVLPIAVFFVLIGMALNAPAFKLAAYFNLTMVFLALPLVLYTGFVEWRDRYRASLTPVFRIKIACAAITTLCVTLLVIWRSFSADAGGFFYLLLHLIALGAAGVAGHLGGKLVFAKRG